MTSLLFLSDITWRHLHQRPQHLATHLSTRWPVLWIEPATLSTKVTWRPERLSDRLHTISVPLFPHNARQKLVRSAAKPLSRIPGARWLALKAQRRIVLRAMDELQMNASDIAILVENFQLIELAGCLRPRALMFDYIDDAFGFSDFPGYVRLLWKKTIRRADAISATTERLKQLIQGEEQKDVRVISNGVDYRFFSEPKATERPADLPPPGKPIAGYVGSIAVWFDFGLLADALRSMPDVNFVLIGRAQPAVRKELEALKKAPNFFFLSFRPYEVLPSYLRHFAVGIIPFARNLLTAAVNPVKLYEYSAAGVPTVTTDFAEDLEQFKSLILLSRTTGEFVDNIRIALQQSQSPAHRSALQEIGRQNDWAAKAKAMEAMIGQQLEAHGARPRR